ncbi:hypothetical protein CC86DRAFT_65997 [Ophiobolus disseminans]|uniref:Uncharacterized protein n=1 Tax=Ophiobolus disseminans TaxID=1469910 RepID=A0A6A6ZQD7_9PLEO|nr:hypothetical protein CC86DRAFT_65997 [Ophiobolus disseminans]
MSIYYHGEFPYNASNRIGTVKWTTRAEEIILQGVPIDEVTFVHANYPGIDVGMSADLESTAEDIQRNIDIIKWEKTMAGITLYGSVPFDQVDWYSDRFMSRVDTYWRTLLANDTDADGDTLTFDSYLEYCAVHTAYIDLMAKYKVVERRTTGEEIYFPPESDEDKYCHATLEPLRNRSAAQHFFRRLARLRGRQIFNTADGRIGFTISGVQPGDIVCVLNNSWTPHVLRIVDSGENKVYKFVGDGYVHGLMNGETDEMDLPVHDLVLA